jgi:dinuclear metal center YbgI/SA1388 family protein
MTLQQTLRLLQAVAPETLAESWDKVGLHVGDPDSTIRRAILCIDFTDAVLAEAIQTRASLVVAYHPPIFQPLTSLTTADPKANLIFRAIQHRIAIYSPHTALDAVTDGINDWLCDALGNGARQPIKPAAPTTPPITDKIITVIPDPHLDRLRSALASAGAGNIGHYTECSFTSPGLGTFRGGTSTHPAIGKRGRFERVPELRLEMVCPHDRLTEIVAALRQNHPYEQPAFDLIRTEPVGGATLENPEGHGRILQLQTPITPATLISRVKKRLALKRLDVALPTHAKKISRIAVCAGAGASLLDQAGPIDAFLTGEMRHHDLLAARERGILVLLPGHTQTERPYLPTYRRRILAASAQQPTRPTPSIQWLISRTDRPPTQPR